MFDCVGSVGGNVSDLNINLYGSVKSLATYCLEQCSHSIDIVTEGGVGGGYAGDITVNVSNSDISTAGNSVSALRVTGTGGAGNTGFEAVGQHWSGSNGETGASIDLSFSGAIDTRGHGIDVFSRGGGRGRIDVSLGSDVRITTQGIASTAVLVSSRGGGGTRC